jgi:AbrB family looped-hinge helix DNA binding protein
METSIITSKGQLLIPKRLRTKYGIKMGGRIILEETENGVLITPMNEQYFKSFAGILTGTGKLDEDIRKMKEEEKNHEHRKSNLHVKPAKKSK